MSQYGIGQSVRRVEDARLVQGQGRYTADVNLEGQVHAVVVRSPHPHARILSIDTAAARGAPGVRLVLTGADYVAEGLGLMPAMVPPQAANGKVAAWVPPYRPIAHERARFVGDAVALVIAETRGQAQDAAELVSVEYEPLAAQTATDGSTSPGAVTVWDERPDNICFVYEVGDERATAAAFASAAHVVSQRLNISRLTVNAMEPRSCVANFEQATRRHTLYTPVQNVFLIREFLANGIFHEPEHLFRVIVGDVGGSFGTKGGFYPEPVLALWASRRLARPVKWVAERSESLLADFHARDNVTDASLALDKDGRFLALRVNTLVNLGAYVTMSGMGPATSNIGSLAGVYTTPAAHVRMTAGFSHTAPTATYRGAGRPEAAYVIERLVDVAAGQLGLAPEEIRRRNTIPADAFPWKTPITFTYDCGDFSANLSLALKMADRAGFETRRQTAAARGNLRGFGISNTIERAVITGQIEYAEVRIDAGGRANVRIGSTDQGQGHRTIFAQVLNERLGIPIEHVSVLEGDSDATPIGAGTGGSSVSARGTAAIVRAADKIIAKGRRVASRLLEAAEADIEFSDGRFSIAGTDRSMSLQEVAKALYSTTLTAEIEPGLFESGTWRGDVFNFPNGCHICELEIDPETGTITLERYSVVDDVGTVLNPMLLEGQIQGGIVQGAGQALFEIIASDPQSGQVLTGSFMDYVMPRADHFCEISMESNPVPTKTNPLGVKGAGEAGTVGALSAVMNAINDALAPLGIRHLEMPATPERVWRAIRAARAPVDPT
jgi:carbon-monoxide dehydrogenase large subunit